MATTDFFIRPEDGWVLVATAPDYIQIKPGNYHPWWVFVSSSAPATAGVANVFATGTITFTDQPTAAEIITVGAVAYEFDDDVIIGSDVEETRDNLLAALAGNAAVTAAAVSTDGIALTATADGLAGDSVVLTTDSGDITLSGSGTLAGGVDEIVAAVGLPFGKDPNNHREGFELPVATSDNVYIRVQDPIAREPVGQKAHFSVLTESA